MLAVTFQLLLNTEIPLSLSHSLSSCFYAVN
jgi:hypothetical protein